MSDEGPGLRELLVPPVIVLGVAFVVVAVVTLGAVFVDGLSTPTQSADTDDPTDGPPPEYEPEAVIAEPIPANGSVVVDRPLRAGGDPKTVVIERSDRVQQEGVRQLVQALSLAGHDVRFRDGDPLMDALENADAYVRVDPATGLSAEDVSTVRNFTAQGGHVVVMAEPNRKRISVSIFGASISTIRTDSVALAAEYGIVFGNRYLYDTEANDGNFKNVLVEPTDAPGAPPFGRAAMYTATRVSVREGRDATVIARTNPSAKLSDGGPRRAYPVVVRTGELLAIGDTTFMSEGRHNVAGNERLVEYVVSFAVRSDRPDAATLDPDAESGIRPPGSTPTPTATPTPTPTPTPTATPNGTDTGRPSQP